MKEFFKKNFLKTILFDFCRVLTVLSKPFLLKKEFPAIQDEKFPFTLNEDLCKAVDGNLFILINNLVEHNKIVFDDMAFIRWLILENCSINMDGNFDILS
ncbi:hypothetical protein MXB_3861 [Myxobolus squamalis]|nr:hypothetical protein MXB_3861 [Myxobolus squamalis]